MSERRRDELDWDEARAYDKARELASLLEVGMPAASTTGVLRQLGDDAVVGLCGIVHMVARASGEWAHERDGAEDVRRAKAALDVLSELASAADTPPLLDALCISCNWDLDDAILEVLCDFGPDLLEPVLARLDADIPQQHRPDRWTVLLDLLIETGIRDDRILRSIVAASEFDSYLCIQMLGRYGDRRALDILGTILDSCSVSADAMVISAANDAIDALGGTLTETQRSKVDRARASLYGSADEN